MKYRLITLIISERTIMGVRQYNYQVTVQRTRWLLGYKTLDSAGGFATREAALSWGRQFVAHAQRGTERRVTYL